MQIVQVKFIDIAWVNWNGLSYSVPTGNNFYYNYFDCFKKPLRIGELVLVPVQEQDIKIAQVGNTLSSEKNTTDYFKKALKFTKYPVISRVNSYANEILKQTPKLIEYKNNYLKNN